MISKLFAALLLSAAGGSFYANIGETLPEQGDETAQLSSSIETFTNAHWAQGSVDSNLLEKAEWANRWVSFLSPSDHQAERLSVCVSDDHDALVSIWSASEDEPTLLSQHLLSERETKGMCDVWYHVGDMESAQRWQSSCAQGALSLSEHEGWLGTGGMVQVMHTESGARFLVDRQKIASARVTPDARMLKLFKDKAS